MRDLGKLIVAKGFKKLPRSAKKRPILSHWYLTRYRTVIYGAASYGKKSFTISIPRTAYGLFTSTTQFALPFLTIILCYSTIIVKLRKRPEERKILGIRDQCYKTFLAVLNGPTSASFIVYFRSFQTNIKIFTAIYVKRSIQYPVPGFEPTTSLCESPPITTRPGLSLSSCLSR